MKMWEDAQRSRWKSEEEEEEEREESKQKWRGAWSNKASWYSKRKEQLDDYFQGSFRIEKTKRAGSLSWS